MELTDETLDILQDIVIDLEERIANLEESRKLYNTADQAKVAKYLEGQVQAHKNMIADLKKRFGVSAKSDRTNLIAAAPDMLNALENLENDDEAIPDHAWWLVQQAIIKAKGGPVW